MKRFILISSLLLLTSYYSYTQDHDMVVTTSDNVESSSDMFNLYSPESINWIEGPASLPKGSKFAVLEGDITKEGFFVLRLWFPDGYIIPPHHHPKAERLTVISGTFNLGMGEAFDKTKTQSLTAGTYGYWPEGMKHFAWVEGESIVQLHGTGPWEIFYVNPEDDPRNKTDDR